MAVYTPSDIAQITEYPIRPLTIANSAYKTSWLYEYWDEIYICVVDKTGL